MRPRFFRIGPPKATNNPIVPTQKQQSITRPKTIKSQGLAFGDSDIGGGGASVVSTMELVKGVIVYYLLPWNQAYPDQW